MYEQNCIILHFYTSCHIKEKCEIFAFWIFFFSLVTNENTWFLYVASNKVFLEFSTTKTKLNKEYLSTWPTIQQ